ncbi:LysR family transcriptional regulator [Caenimonas aquaedulcis]|uniref:LysR family transcriptional regulator n=1 Tax=Caenimonas aquaedulcis TaxID=2793270 RepID=A0A931H4F7_9BURK|nr:LysR family transcriptional regulator [Caenimonas aquaedulcis]MBG9388434.1 LysR family transcriptional regulator [Caenimonas aquaedulcis]
MSRNTSSQDMQFFAQLIRCASLAALARELQVTPAAVSKRLTSLEARLGVPLLNRTTRRLSLTEQGRTYLDSARRILEEIEAVESGLQAARAQPAGLLRVNATLGFGRMQVAPAIASFSRKYPRVEVQLQLTASPPPIVDEAYDVGIRFGEPPDSRLVARMLAPNRRLLCASAAYLARAGTPRNPQELARHNFISIRQADDAQGLLRLTSGRRTETVKAHGNLSTNDGEVAVGWALAGLGVVLRAEWDVARYLRSGRLQPVLENWQTPPADIHAVYPLQHAKTMRVQAFVEHLSRYFAG